MTARRRAWLVPLILLALAVAVLALAIIPEPADEGPGVFIRIDEPETVSGELVVRFGEIPVAQRDAIVASVGATIEREYSLDGYVKLAVPAGEEEAIGELLATDPAVRSAEEVAYRTLMLVPNDELYDDQWNLEMIQMEQAWDLSTGAAQGSATAGGGEGVVVAVLDSGVAYEDYNDVAAGRQYKRAPDLATTKFVAPFDMFDDDPHANDDNGHGTHVTGTIAQATNNGIGVAGIAFNARIMPVKVCGDQDGNLATPDDYYCPDDAIAEGIIYAVNNGARVINMSFGGEIPLGKGSLHRQALEYARAANVVVVGAAGNGGADFIGGPILAYPAAIPSVISVGAAGSNGQKASYSDYGLGEVGNQMDLVAPGGDGYAGGKYIRQNTFAHKCTAGVPVNLTLFGYCYMRGTSQAAAHVSGVAALIRSKYPQMPATQVRTLMNCSALDVGNPGVDLQHGHGLVQAYWALVDSDADGVPNCLDTSPGVVCNVPLVTPTPVPTDTPAPTPTDTPAPLAVPAGVPPTDTPPPPTDTPPPPTDTPPPPTDTPPPPTDTPPPATDTPVPTDTPAPETDTPVPTETPPPIDTPTPSPTEAGTGTPSATPTAVPTDTPTPSPTGVAPNCGDVDCDGDLDAVDALFILRFVAELEPYAACMPVGDADCSGIVNAVDALAVLRELVSFTVNRLPGCPPLGYS